MKTRLGISLLAASALLVACGGGDDDGAAAPPVGGGPAPPPATPMPVDFNLYALSLVTGSSRDRDQPEDVAAVMFGPNNDDPAAFSTLFP